MSRLTYLLFPLLIVACGISSVGWEEPDQIQQQIKYSSEHLTVISAEPPDDLNFCQERVPLENFDVKERLDAQLQRYLYYHSATILHIKRANRYEATIQEILKENEIPEDFFYLAMAESGLTNAISPAGARGFWQFMESAAEEYDLEISATVDERYHPEKATYAACNYLKDAYKKFNDWTLVAASYNRGMAGVQRTIKKQGVNDYYKLHFNRETAAYVFRILTLKTIVGNPERYGFQVKSLYKPIPYRTVKVSESIESLVEFAKEENTTYRMIKVMNPWLIDDHLHVKEGKTYEIRIPLREDIYADELEPAE